MLFILVLWKTSTLRDVQYETGTPNPAGRGRSAFKSTGQSPVAYV